MKFYRLFFQNLVGETINQESVRPRCHECSEYCLDSEDRTGVGDPEEITSADDLANRSPPVIPAYLGTAHTSSNQHPNNRPVSIARKPSSVTNTATIRHLASNLNHHHHHHHHLQNRHAVTVPTVTPGSTPPKACKHLHTCPHSCQNEASQSSIPSLSLYQNLQSNGNGSTPNISRSFAMEMREARAKAILVDRFSRVFFPLSFTILNIMYWYTYFEW